MADLFGGQSSQFRQLACYFLHKGRFVALAAMRNGREKRTIGFDQDAFEWNLFRDIADLLGFGEGDVSGKRNHEAEIKCAFGVRPFTSEAVKDAAQSTC